VRSLAWTPCWRERPRIAICLLAIAHQQSGELEQAERLYRSLPDLSESWNNLGVILKNGGKDQEARQAFDRALQLDPGLAEAALNVGRPPAGLWTELHQQYLPGRPMMAPPRRTQVLRAYVGMSLGSLYLRAWAGPFVRGVRLLDIFFLPAPLAAAARAAVIVTVVLLLLAIVLMFLIPSREVT